ncbi:MAG: hypothetical protein K2W96_07020 [Gemmataceae bacterium]|nr:hypothetical protein [Gemmataceae bacterium]
METPRHDVAGDLSRLAKLAEEIESDCAAMVRASRGSVDLAFVSLRRIAALVGEGKMAQAMEQRSCWEQFTSKALAAGRKVVEAVRRLAPSRAFSGGPLLAESAALQEQLDRLEEQAFQAILGWKDEEGLARVAVSLLSIPQDRLAELADRSRPRPELLAEE